MSEKRFTFEYDDGQWGVPLFYDDGKKLCFDDVVRLLNEQQATINLLLEELINAQQQGYVVDFLHKNEHCSLIPKELEDE